MQLISSGFNNIQIEGFNSCAILTVQKMWKKSSTHSNINVKH
jgi:hypothetical protein